METVTHIGLIGRNMPDDAYPFDINSREHGYRLKKVLVKSQEAGRLARIQYPNAEIVRDSKAILDDNSIDLIIVSGPDDADMDLVAEAMQAGKQVRIL